MGMRRIRVSTGTGTGNLDFTVTPSVGASPVAAMFLMNGNTGAGETNPNMLAVGFTDGTNHRCGVFVAEHGVNPTNTWTKLVNDTPLISIDPNTGSINGVADFSSFGTDKVTLNISDAFPASYTVTAVLWFEEGTGYDVAVGSFTGSGSPSVNLGWEPDQVFLFAASESLSAGFTGKATTSGDAGGAFGFGFLDNGASDVQRGLAWNDNDGETVGGAGTRAQCTIDEGIIWEDCLGSGDITLTSTGTGFNVSGTGGFAGYLAVKYNGNNQHKAASIDTPTSTGDHAITGVGFQPTFVLEIQSVLTTYNTVSDIAGFGWGIATLSSADTVDDVAMSGRTDASLGSTSTGSRHPSNTASIVKDYSAGTSLTATLSSFDSDGYTKNFTAVAGTVRKSAYIALGPAAATGGPVEAMFQYRRRRV